MVNFFTKTLKAGLLVGTLDISAAFIQFYLKTGKNPLKVLTYIASAVFGNDAFTAGDIMKIWGLLFHYGVAYAFTLFFFLIFPKVYALFKNKILIAILYGPYMWVVMKYLILPLTKIPGSPATFEGATTAILILIFCIAIPLTFIAAKYYKEKK